MTMEGDTDIEKVIKGIRVAYGLVSRNAHMALYGGLGMQVKQVSCCEIVREVLKSNAHPLFKGAEMEDFGGVKRTFLILRNIEERVEYRGLRPVNRIERDAVYAQALLDLISLACKTPFKLVMIVNLISNRATLEFIGLVKQAPLNEQILNEQLNAIKMLSRTTHCRDTEHQVGEISYDAVPHTLKFAGMNANLAMLIWIAFSGTKEIKGHP